MRRARKRILAVSSAGGHWTELLRLRPAFAGHEVAFVTTTADCRSQVTGHRFYVVPDANARTKLKLLALVSHIIIILLKERPDVIISTGAAPGYFAIRIGYYLRARTLWLESIANADELSLSTRLIKPYADLTLTQWPHMAAPDGPYYRGSVL